MFQKSSETDSDLYMNNIYKYTVSVSNFNLAAEAQSYCTFL